MDKINSYKRAFFLKGNNNLLAPCFEKLTLSPARIESNSPNRSTESCDAMNIIFWDNSYQGKLSFPRSFTARMGSSKTDIMPAPTSIAALSGAISPEETPISLMITIKGRPVAE